MEGLDQRKEGFLGLKRKTLRVERLFGFLGKAFLVIVVRLLGLLGKAFVVMVVRLFGVVGKTLGVVERLFGVVGDEVSWLRWQEQRNQ